MGIYITVLFPCVYVRFVFEGMERIGYKNIAIPDIGTESVRISTGFRVYPEWQSAIFFYTYRIYRKDFKILPELALCRRLYRLHLQCLRTSGLDPVLHRLRSTARRTIDDEYGLPDEVRMYGHRQHE